MRLCVTGTGSQGKTTFINDFLKEWPSYTTPKTTYRDGLGDHGKKTDKDIQWKILIIKLNINSVFFWVILLG